MHCCILGEYLREEISGPLLGGGGAVIGVREDLEASLVVPVKSWTVGRVTAEALVIPASARRIELNLLGMYRLLLNKTIKLVKVSIAYFYTISPRLMRRLKGKRREAVPGGRKPPTVEGK